MDGKRRGEIIHVARLKNDIYNLLLFKIIIFNKKNILNEQENKKKKIK
jgi:hypothetical protein